MESLIDAQAVMDWIQRLLIRSDRPYSIETRTDRMVILSGLRFWSLCEQGIPFWCELTIGLPAFVEPPALGNSLGLSRATAPNIKSLLTQVADQTETVTPDIAVYGCGGYLREIAEFGCITLSADTVFRGIFQSSTSWQFEFFYSTPRLNMSIIRAK